MLAAWHFQMIRRAQPRGPLLSNCDDLWFTSFEGGAGRLGWTMMGHALEHQASRSPDRGERACNRSRWGRLRPAREPRRIALDAGAALLTRPAAYPRSPARRAVLSNDPKVERVATRGAG